MYWGRFEGKIDKKNRVFFPSRIREQTGSSLLITNWFEQSLVIVPQTRANLLIEDWHQESFLQSEVRDMELFVFGSSSEVELDSQGRFVVEKHLREYAKMEREIIFTGGRNYVRMWAREIFENYFDMTRLRSSAIAQKLYEKLDRE